MPNPAVALPASLTVLEECPGRALTFLRGIAKLPVVHSLLAGAGFDADEYQLGWKLLHDAAGYNATPPAPPARTAALEAQESLDAWDEDGMRRIRAALYPFHQAQEEFVFAGGLGPSTGPEAVVGVSLLLGRPAALKDGPDRKATRKADHAALATLAKRGFDDAEIARLTALVKTATTVAAPAAEGPGPVGVEALVALYEWYRDWADTAKSVVKKRAHLITLGLAKRRASKGEAEAEAPAPKGEKDA